VATNSYEIELLNTLNDGFKDELVKYSKFIECSKATTPFYADELLEHFYIVASGKIRTYQINLQNNKEQTIFIYKNGDMFDVISLLDNKKHDVLYEAMEDTRLLQLPIKKVREWLENDREFNCKFFPYLAQQMRHTEALAVDIALYDTKDRLINLLIDNVDKSKHFRYQLLQSLSNTQIASLIGTVRHVIERSLKELKDDNTIAKSNKNIRILNFQKLLEKTNKLVFKQF